MTAVQTLGVGIIGASRVAPQHALGVATACACAGIAVMAGIAAAPPAKAIMRRKNPRRGLLPGIEPV